MTTKTLILSDLHLGNKHCHTRAILDTLEREPWDRVILNGDTIHHLNLHKLQAPHWTVLDRLREVGRKRELILVRGNHDHDPKCSATRFGSRDILPSLLGVPMVPEYKVHIEGKPYLVLHGDRFDPTLNRSLLDDVADWCFGLSQKINKKLAKWLKKKLKRFGGVLEWIRCRSAAHALRHGYEGVITGHTHHADDDRIGAAHYVNSGCWTSPVSSYLVLDAERVELRRIPH